MKEDLHSCIPRQALFSEWGKMRFVILAFCIVQGIWYASCGTVSVRPVHEVSKANREFDGGIWYAFPRMSFRHTAEFDQKIKSSRYGIEVAVPVSSNIECFADASHVGAEYFYWF